MSTDINTYKEIIRIKELVDNDIRLSYKKAKQLAINYGTEISFWFAIEGNFILDELAEVFAKRDSV